MGIWYRLQQSCLSLFLRDVDELIIVHEVNQPAVFKKKPMKWLYSTYLDHQKPRGGPEISRDFARVISSSQLDPGLSKLLHGSSMFCLLSSKNETIYVTLDCILITSLFYVTWWAASTVKALFIKRGNSSLEWSLQNCIVS